MSRFMRYMLFLTVLLGWAVQAADNPAPQSQDAEESQVEQDSSAAENTEDVEVAFEDGEESPERFIPTEEISQDLGVSFPVDI